MNILKSNIQTMSVISSYFKVTPVLIFDIYTTDNNHISFTCKASNGSLVGKGKINGVTAPIKELLTKSDWYNKYISVSLKDSKLSNAIYIKDVDDKLKRLKDLSSIYSIETTSKIVEDFQQQVYRELLNYRYSKLNLSTLSTLLYSSKDTYKHILSLQDDEIVTNIIDNIINAFKDYIGAYPQFKGNVSKIIAMNFFYMFSPIYKSKYSPLKVQKKVSYSFLTFYNRLLGYLNFRTKTAYSPLEFKDMVINFINREHVFIKAEHNLSLNKSIKDLYKAFISSLCINSTIYKDNAISTLLTLAAPSPSSI